MRLESVPADAAETIRVLRVRVAQLEQALDSRVVIEQAKGVLSERHELSVDEAFELLRRAARSNHLRVRALAADVVASPVTPGPIVRVLNGG